MLSLPEKLLMEHRGGFAEGFTQITREDDSDFELGVDFGIHVMQNSRRFDEKNVKECVWVLMDGEARLEYGDGQSASVRRNSLFDEAPTALHLPADTPVHIQAESERVEWAVVRATNDKPFPAHVYWPSELSPEYRGLGLAQGTCLRNVRLIFDYDVQPLSQIVLGEVINYPGRWSSYPPHHHAQPELYHYRFDKPQGYGHGEVGDEVHRIQAFDTLRIPGMHDHAQVAAPGYAMYYLWIVRHLPAKPYTGFEFTSEHEWLLDEKACIWQPQEGPFSAGRPEKKA